MRNGLFKTAAKNLKKISWPDVWRVIKENNLEKVMGAGVSAEVGGVALVIAGGTMSFVGVGALCTGGVGLLVVGLALLIETLYLMVPAYEMTYCDVNEAELRKAEATIQKSFFREMKRNIKNIATAAATLTSEDLNSKTNQADPKNQ
jgi:hypothetical protein